MYMFRTTYVHLQEDCTVHVALYGMFSMHLCKQSTRFEGCALNIPYKVTCKYSLPEDEHKMFETCTCRRQEELN